jgi:hypothetical protein
MNEERRRKIVVPIASGSNNPQPRNTLDIPGKRSSYGLGNFKIWGTFIDDSLRIAVRCMRCGRVNHSLDYDPTSR